MPGVDVAARVEAEKGSAADRARAARSSTSASARRAAWLEAYAPERAVVKVQRDRCPPRRADLDDDQRAFLAALADAADGRASRDRRRLAGR